MTGAGILNPVSLSEKTSPPLWRLIAIGLVAGLLSGAFGVGGGVLIVPALVVVLGMQQRLAHGTSLAAVVPISVVGAATYLIGGNVDLGVAGLLMIGTVAGAIWGVKLLGWLSETWLRWLFIAFMILVAVRMFFEVPNRDASVELTGWLVLILIGLGLLTGVLSGLLGVGGGVFMVPVLILFLELSDITAKGVSLLVVIPTGLIATFFSLRKGNVDLRAASAIGIAGAATTIGGAALAFWLDPMVASILFAVFLLVIAIRMAIHALLKRKKSQQSQSKGNGNV
ncbi:MAG TPA: sulfite exporter TauE/SafE family protein [Terrimesophilobacter sp.]|uniref:sulfite exporter TauE/SafE family protein n=1 Tax=Terrimesophilobacter sp. TaxID=2906435 RepID=UPI002F952570